MRAIEGPIRIPLDSQLFLFNALALLNISPKSFRFRSVLFSIPTAPTNICLDLRNPAGTHKINRHIRFCKRCALPSGRTRIVFTRSLLDTSLYAEFDQDPAWSKLKLPS
jgi:hypothetical protein